MVAEMGIMGLPVMEFLEGQDPTLQSLLVRAHRQGWFVIDDLLSTLARKIISDLSDALDRG